MDCCLCLYFLSILYVLDSQFLFHSRTYFCMQSFIQLTITQKNVEAGNRGVQGDLRQYHTTIKRNKMDQGEIQGSKPTQFSNLLWYFILINCHFFNWTRVGGWREGIRRRIKQQKDGLACLFSWFCLFICKSKMLLSVYCPILTNHSKMSNTRETGRFKPQYNGGIYTLFCA